MPSHSESEEDDIRPEPAAPLSSQQMVELFASHASIRLPQLLRLRCEHFFDAVPGQAADSTATPVGPVRLRQGTTSQPYRTIERFANLEHVIGFIVNPGLIPIVKSLTVAAQGKKILVTRRLAIPPADTDVFAHLVGFGVRLKLHFEPESQESVLTWDWLYGVA